jgi:beta-phosphoglucomutase-like phosphatase (HAD superfamily)
MDARTVAPGRDGPAGAATPSVDPASLVASWRLALDAAQTALRAARADLPRDELQARSQRLTYERTVTTNALQGLAGDPRTNAQLLLLTASPRERQKPAPDAVLAARRELGTVPEHAAAFETTSEGVAAARNAGVVGVDGSGQARALKGTAQMSSSRIWSSSSAAA